MNGLSIKQQVHFTRGRSGRKRLEPGEKPAGKRTTPPAVPRVSRLMALAIHFDQLIRDGVVADYADLARLGRVTRARVTQIMNLLNLAPNIQEELLFLAKPENGRERITEKGLRPIAGEVDWQRQRGMWASLDRNSQLSLNLRTSP